MSAPGRQCCARAAAGKPAAHPGETRRKTLTPAALGGHLGTWWELQSPLVVSVMEQCVCPSLQSLPAQNVVQPRQESLTSTRLWGSEGMGAAVLLCATRRQIVNRGSLDLLWITRLTCCG